MSHRETKVMLREMLADAIERSATTPCAKYAPAHPHLGDVCWCGHSMLAHKPDLEKTQELPVMTEDERKRYRDFLGVNMAQSRPMTAAELQAAGAAMQNAYPPAQGGLQNVAQPDWYHDCNIVSGPAPKPVRWYHRLFGRRGRK